MRNFAALLLVFHLSSLSNTSCESETSKDHYYHRIGNLPAGSNILDDNRLRASSRTSLTDTPNQPRNVGTRNLETQILGEIAYATYAKVLPCLNSNWMMESWMIKNFTFPVDAEEHFRSLKAKTETFRKTKIHHYAKYDGAKQTFIAKSCRAESYSMWKLIP